MPQKNGVLVVTGGSRGIGAATAILGAERGYAVVVNYTSNVDAAERVCARIHQQGGEAVAVRGDVSQPEDVERHEAERLEPGEARRPRLLSRRLKRHCVASTMPRRLWPPAARPPPHQTR